VRNRRHHRSTRRRARRSRAGPRHEPDHRPPRAGWRWLLPVACLRAARGAGDAPPEHHRPEHRRPADLQRGSQPGAGLQRRDLQLRRAAQRAGDARPHVPHPGRYRDARPRLRRIRAGCVRPPARHVRLRAVGRARRAAGAGGRSRGDQAAVPGRARRAAAVRVRGQSPVRRSLAAAPPEPGHARHVPQLRLHDRDRHAVRGHPPPAARPRADRGGRRHAAGRALEHAVPDAARPPDRPRSRGGRSPRAPDRLGAAAPAQRRAAGPVPERRGRLRDHAGADEPPGAGADPDLLGGLRRGARRGQSRRRDAQRPAHRGALRRGSPRADHHRRRLVGLPAGLRLPPRRAERQPVDHLAPGAGSGDRRARQGGAQRDRWRRIVLRLPLAPPLPLGDRHRGPAGPAGLARGAAQAGRRPVGACRDAVSRAAPAADHRRAARLPAGVARAVPAAGRRAAPAGVVRGAGLLRRAARPALQPGAALRLGRRTAQGADLRGDPAPGLGRRSWRPGPGAGDPHLAAR